ncbi:HTH_Tnp_Tc3_2 domain-containing protein [Trichonephila clavipes]|nr:HTH_Tnp_Tc3_2 domain-containing protein [Trichonephila clavipes]
MFHARFTVLGFGSRRPTRIPLLNDRHQAARLAWARDCSVEDWKRVSWSDESRFRRLNVIGRLRIWRQAHEAWILHVSCWVIISIRLYCSIIRTVMEFSSKTTVSLTSPVWLLAGWMSIPDFSVINWPPRLKSY